MKTSQFMELEFASIKEAVATYLSNYAANKAVIDGLKYNYENVSDAKNKPIPEEFDNIILTANWSDESKPARKVVDFLATKGVKSDCVVNEHDVQDYPFAGTGDKNNNHIFTTYLCADPYGCPIHHHGHSSKDRRCSCKIFWTDDPSNKVNVIANWNDSEQIRKMKIEKYETE